MVWEKLEKEKTSKSCCCFIWSSSASFLVLWLSPGHTPWVLLLSGVHCGCFLSLPLRTPLTICGLWRIWKLPPVSKINSFKNRAQEATNHLFHRAWLISEVLQLVPFEVLFPFLFYFIFFQQVSKTQRPTHMCPATGWGWQWLLQLTLFGRGWATALFGKLSQILEIRFQKPVEMFPKAPWLQWEVVLLCHLNLGLKREGKGRKPKPKTNPKT